MNNKEKVEFLIKSLNSEFLKKKNLFSPETLYNEYKNNKLVSITKHSFDLSNKYKDDFLFDLEFGRIFHLPYTNRFNTIINLSKGGETFQVLEKIVINNKKLENVQYEII